MGFFNVGDPTPMLKGITYNDYNQQQVQGGVAQVQGQTAKEQGSLSDILMQGLVALNPTLFATGQNPLAPTAPTKAANPIKPAPFLPSNGKLNTMSADAYNRGMGKVMVSVPMAQNPQTGKWVAASTITPDMYYDQKSLAEFDKANPDFVAATKTNPALTREAFQEQKYQQQVAQYNQQQQQYQQQQAQGPSATSPQGMLNQGNQLIQQSTTTPMGALSQTPGFTPIAPSKNQDFTLNQSNGPGALNLGNGPGQMNFNQVAPGSLQLSQQAPGTLSTGQQAPSQLNLGQQAPGSLQLNQVNTKFTDPSQQNVAALNLTPNQTGPLKLNDVNSQFTPLSPIDAMQYGNVDTSQYAPFIKNGQLASNQLASLSGIGDNPLSSQQIYDQYLNNPAVQAQMDQGNRSINNSYSAKGLLGSGGLLKALNSYGQGVAAQTLGQAQANLFNQAQLGGNAANQYTGSLLSKYGTDMGAQASNQANQVGQQRNQVDLQTNQAAAQNAANSNLIGGYTAQNNAASQIQQNQIGAYQANQAALNANGTLNLAYQTNQANAGLQQQQNQTNAYSAQANANNAYGANQIGAYTAQNNASNQYAANNINAYTAQNNAQNQYGQNQINAYGTQATAQNQYGQNQINAYNGQAAAQNAYGANQVAGYNAQGNYANNAQQNQINAYSANQSVQAQQQALQLQYQQYANQAGLQGQQNQINAYTAQQNAINQARANQTSLFGQQAGMLNTMSTNNATYAGLLSSLAGNTQQLGSAAINNIGSILGNHVNSTQTEMGVGVQAGNGYFSNIGLK